MKRRYTILLVLFFTTIIYGHKSIDIDLSNQKLYAKENGRVVFSGNISTGTRSHPTPRGIFRVIDKERFHISNRYPEPNGGAKMPYMLRLTKKGIAIHQGYLPGYPASHGCIRVSKKTALKLWRWSSIGTKVRIYGNISNFRYAKRKKYKKRYSKNRKKSRYSKYKRYSKGSYYKKRRYAKKRAYKRRYKKSVSRHYANRDYCYEIIEVYDSW